MAFNQSLALSPGRPRLPTPEERLRRLRIAEKASAYAERVIEVYAGFLNDETLEPGDRMTAGKWLYEAAYGKPKQQPDDDQPAGTQVIRYEIRWMPPDPADTSIYIEPEKD